MARRYLLSIDGGGIRGIIPATVLVKLETQTGRPARETFHFLAGTSTGAIIASGLAAGIPAQQILDVYLTRSDEVFPQRPWNGLKRIFLGYVYSIRKLRQVIAEESGEAEDWVVNDSPVDLLVTAKRIRDGKPWYFVKDTPQNSGRTGRLPLVDCVTASAAAPTYFRPWTIPEPTPPPGEEPVGELVDGGVGVAGNPVYQACVEAFYFTDKYDPAETTIVSLGTGRSELAEETPGWLYEWVQWLIAELLRSPGEQQTEIVQRHFPDSTFHRIDIELEESIGMDEVGKIDELKVAGEKLAAETDWDAILA
jgi:patatin-like phospholipase/acyl hydrolase